MATFKERAAHSVNLLFILLCPFVVLVVSHLRFQGRGSGSDYAISLSLLSFYSHHHRNRWIKNNKKIDKTKDCTSSGLGIPRKFTSSITRRNCGRIKNICLFVFVYIYIFG